MVFDFSLSSPSTSYQLPGTVEPWFQVSILTATILMNRFHHLIPGFFSPIEVCFLSSPFSPPTVWFSTVLESCQNQVSQPGSHSPPSFWHILCFQRYHKPGVSRLFLSCPQLKQLGVPSRVGTPFLLQSLSYFLQFIPALCIPVVFIISSL